MHEWYRISDEDALDTPGVVVYRDRIKTNIDTLIKSIDDVNRLETNVTVVVGEKQPLLFFIIT